MISGLVLLFLLSGAVWSNENCSYQRIIDHLELINKKNEFTLSRPVKDAAKPLDVYLKFTLQAILDVREVDQTFISYSSIDIFWKNEHISWDGKDFCDIYRITVPTELLWRPDLRIEEVIDKDKSPVSPFLVITDEGNVLTKNDQVVISTCRMDMYKFPFDTQSCNLSFRSFVHSDKELRLKFMGSGIMNTYRTKNEMHTQYEWLFKDITVTNITEQALNENQPVVVYTITMRRRSVLYVVNFIFPVLFFLCLDFASFLMSDTGGEKLGFKITVLLAVTVLQLLLNEILPSSSDRIPLVVIFCIGVFWLMMLSLMESIVVMYLMEKDSKSQDHRQEKTEREDNNDNALKDSSWFSYLHKSSPDDLLHDHTTEDKKVSRHRTTDDGSDFEKLLDELRNISRMLSEYVQSGKEEVKPGYWTRKIQTINRVFLLFYTVCTAVFLSSIFYCWLN